MIKKAFTLAEVLIVIGIIGVVAALTIPTLIANANSKKISSQFKKSISTLNQAVKLGEANYDLNFSNTDYCYRGDNIERGIKSLCNFLKLTLKVSLEDSTSSISSGASTTIFGQRYKIGTLQTTEIFGNPDYFIYQMPDGAMLFICPGAGNCSLRDGVLSYSKYSDLSDGGCYGFIDVNGITLPNKEVTCTTGTTSTDLTEPCTVKNSKDMGDIFPIAFFDERLYL